VYDFLDNPETQAVFFKENKGTIEISDTPCKAGVRGVLFYIVKLNKAAVSEDKIAKEIVCGDVGGDPLEHMATLAQRIYLPMLSSNDSTVVWTESIAKEVRDNFETFVSNVQITQGHIKGITCLPLPSTGGPKKDDEFGNLEVKEGGSSEADAMHSQIHALEGAIITWTKQIKNVLKKDSESVFQATQDPGPLVEVDFWLSKASNLNGIFDRLGFC
jgi:dynein heavy chain